MIIKFIQILLMLFLISSSHAYAYEKNDDATIMIGETKIIGTVIQNSDGEKLLAWFGIPFAQPPVGELRWKAPRNIEIKGNELDASNLPNHCVQVSNFYDEILEIIDIIRVDEDDNERYVGYAKEQKNNIADFYIMIPFDKNDATIGNGTMITFDAGTQVKVNSIHKKALELGAKNEGDPGPRHGEHYYAYFRDLDGNKICIFSNT